MSLDLDAQLPPRAPATATRLSSRRTRISICKPKSIFNWKSIMCFNYSFPAPDRLCTKSRQKRETLGASENKTSEWQPQPESHNPRRSMFTAEKAGKTHSNREHSILRSVPSVRCERLSLGHIENFQRLRNLVMRASCSDSRSCVRRSLMFVYAMLATEDTHKRSDVCACAGRRL